MAVVVVAGAAVRLKSDCSPPIEPNNAAGVLPTPAPLLLMFLSLETLAAIATIAGTVISILVIMLAIGVAFYARRQRVARESASNVVEGYSIDSLNVANLRRRLDRNFVVQEADHAVRVEGTDMKITWRYSGYCRAESASAFEFSIESGPGISFGELDCAAFDLVRDPNMARMIRPILVGPEGISKKISAPLLEPVARNQPFAVLLTCTLPSCLTPGTAYYTSTLSFAQKSVPRCTIRMEFAGAEPVWMRVYECAPRQQPKLLKSLSPVRQIGGFCEYVDVMENIPGQSARVYLFRRETV